VDFFVGVFALEVDFEVAFELAFKAAFVFTFALLFTDVLVFARLLVFVFALTAPSKVAAAFRGPLDRVVLMKTNSAPSRKNDRSQIARSNWAHSA
jgi:hypothetical protein